MTYHGHVFDSIEHFDASQFLQGTIDKLKASPQYKKLRRICRVAFVSLTKRVVNRAHKICEEVRPKGQL
jgi:hypothetical protein